MITQTVGYTVQKELQPSHVLTIIIIVIQLVLPCMPFALHSHNNHAYYFLQYLYIIYHVHYRLQCYKAYTKSQHRYLYAFPAQKC